MAVQENADYGEISTTEFTCESDIKIRCRRILPRRGIPMSTAVDMFLNQVVLVGGIPFSVTVPKPPADIDATQMTEAQIVMTILS